MHVNGNPSCCGLLKSNKTPTRYGGFCRSLLSLLICRKQSCGDR
nr:MAG TPA: hypothetical protein [Caudoviricetes sp.]